MLKGSSGPPGGQPLTEMDVKTLLVVLLWAGVTVSTLVDLQKRIIGGRDCGPTERLFHVRLISRNGTRISRCGGSLISERWILTAAHCWKNDSTWNMTAHFERRPNQLQEAPMPVTVHHIYTDPQNRDHDIMLLQLPNATQSPHIALPDCNNPPDIGDEVEVAGYGSTTMGADNKRERGRADVLQCVHMPIVDCQELRDCLQTSYPGSWSDYERWRSYYSPNKSTSPGDSGGGVVFNDMIYGVHSFTGNHTHACVVPMGFMDVCGYIDWIYNTTGIARPAGTGAGAGAGAGARFWSRLTQICSSLISCCKKQ